jgi:arylsulfatase A-like enzyme
MINKLNPMRLSKFYFTLCILALGIKTTAQESPNVVFIAIDDLNDWVGCLKGHPQTITPNIDKLASKGILFTNANCQAPICGPSRASVMTGLLPTTTGNYLQLDDQFIKKSNDVGQNAIFLPDYFEQYGYKTMGVGKLFHLGDNAHAFDEYETVTTNLYGPLPSKRIHYDPEWYGKPKKTATDWGAFPDDEIMMPDYKSAAWAVEKLKIKHQKPFFLAVGFVRPHVPWYVPQKYMDKFPLDQIQTPPYLKSDMDDVPKMGQMVAEVPMMPTTEWMIETNQWKNAVQSYLACINFVDEQVGKVLDALEKSPYANNTIVVLWSDHGYHLGEKNRFAKQALWQRDTKSVLLFKTPQGNENVTCNKPVQLLDIYPTLTELCKLPKNKMNEGHSLLPLLKNPVNHKWPHVAITSYGKGNVAITDSQYRLIQYEDNSIEFYDLYADPNEWHNLAFDKKYSSKIEKLRKHIPKKQAKLSLFSKYEVNEHFKNAGKEE